MHFRFCIQKVIKIHLTKPTYIGILIVMNGNDKKRNSTRQLLADALRNTHGDDSYWVRSAENAIESLSGYIKRKFSLISLSETEDIHLRMFVYGTTEICAYWAENNLKTPIEDMCDLILAAVPETLKKYF